MTIEYFTRSISSLEWKKTAAVANSHSGFFHRQGIEANTSGGAHLRLQHEEKFVDQFLVPKSSAGLIEHGGLALLVPQRGLVRPLRAQRIVDVTHLERACQYGDICPAQSVRISAAVPMLMMMADDG